MRDMRTKLIELEDMVIDLENELRQVIKSEHLTLGDRDCAGTLYCNLASLYKEIERRMKILKSQFGY